jgi:hypothetical protein
MKPVVHWSFHDYVQGFKNPVEEWYSKSLSDAGRFQLDSLLKNVATTEQHIQWVGFKYLKGEPRTERIWQLDFLADGRQYRALGVFGSIRRQAVLLVGCYHKGKTYTPPDALDTAVKRAKNLREGRATTRERKIKIDV